MGEENYIQQLADYIKKNLAKGYTIESLKIALENQDYSKLSVERAVKLANEQLASKAPVMKEKPVIRHSFVDDSGHGAGKTKDKERFLKKDI